MLYRLLADGVLLLHLAFVVFVLLGALLALRWRWLPWLHLPAVAWGALVELNGWLCPLTPLEVRLRILAGDAGYAGGFVERYLLPLVYPPGLTADTQALLGGVVLGLNAGLYG
ncbi:MAG TPA: DUF2784 domain-containing protein, partial [Gammaproteobacteria bacterium]